MKHSIFTSDKMLINVQQINEGLLIEWGWTSLEEDAENKPGKIHNICLSCGATNVNEASHQCDGRQAA